MTIGLILITLLGYYGNVSKNCNGKLHNSSYGYRHYYCFDLIQRIHEGMNINNSHIIIYVL